MPVNEVINTATIGAATAVVGFLTKNPLPEPTPPAEEQPVENGGNSLPVRVGDLDHTLVFVANQCFIPVLGTSPHTIQGHERDARSKRTHSILL